MRVKLFVFGRSGCGKSKTSKHISTIIGSYGWTTKRFMDYGILYQMFQDERVNLRFTKAKGGGFDIHDVQAFDDALKRLERDVLAHCQNIDNHQSHSHELLIIEFARKNYDDTFKKLSQDILQDAHFLLINADFYECRKRIKERRTSSEQDSNDNHNVSDFAMNTYFKEQLPPENPSITSRLTTLTNNGSWDDFTKELEPFIRHILNIPDSDN